MNSLWSRLTRSPVPPRCTFHGREASVALDALSGASALGEGRERLRGRSVLIAAREPLHAALALVELDGLARRMVLCTPDLGPEQLRRIASTAEADSLVYDAAAGIDSVPAPIRVAVSPALNEGAMARERPLETEWILLTSGTSGEPKLVVHSLEGLAGALPAAQPVPPRSPGPPAGSEPPAPTHPGAASDPAADAVWSTFYDIRRYGGLQIFLRAVVGRCPLVLASPEEPLEEFLGRMRAAGVTHVSGTPSHWRRVLMSGCAERIAPRYLRLSGEIADQAILDALRTAYPAAVIAHAFASTEAGVAFDVTDGRAGFPAEFLGSRGSIDMQVVDGTLRIRSARTAARYLGTDAVALVGAEGFVDTGDIVELRDGRYHFLGRRGGVINVGGLKVHPEEVEAVINADPRVRMSLVRPRRNPITGAIVVAEVVLNADSAASSDPDVLERVRHELIAACRSRLPAHKVPTSLRFVPALAFTAAGKLVRPG